jgi:hypothetical protein
MADPFRSKKLTQLLALFRKFGLRLKSDFALLVIGTILIVISLGFIFNQPTAILSDNPPENNVEPTDQAPSSLASFADSQGLDNSKAGAPLTEIERQRIIQILGESTAIPLPPRFEQTPKFILHDTAGELSDATLQEMTYLVRGPLGNGAAAYLPREGKEIIVRPNFFDLQRPTATEYEKAADILSERARNREARQIWQATNTASQKAVLEVSLAGLDRDRSSLIKRATLWLTAPSEGAFAAIKARSPGLELDGAKTTALWAIAEVCRSALDNEASAIAMASSSPQAKRLQDSCQKLGPLLKESQKRTFSAVNIEIVQRRGADCWIWDSQVKEYNSKVGHSLKIRANRVPRLHTADRPAYTANQYEGLARLYLRAALQAGQFPEVTTHFWVDQGMVGKIGDHCDPRGLDLRQLYQGISDAIAHPPGTRYGIEPQYGLNPEAGDNVWWAEQVFGLSYPQ